MLNELFYFVKVKELGVLITDCSCLADDVSKIFNVYWNLGQKDAEIPQKWPIKYSTNINDLNPVSVRFNNLYKMNSYISVSYTKKNKIFFTL